MHYHYPTLTSSFISSLDWIKNGLFYCNLQETWQTQTVGNEHQFIEVLKEKFIYFSNQKWIETIQSSRRFDVYKSFKPFRYKEIYISVVNIKSHRIFLASFRMGMSNIFTNKCRFLVDE